MKNWSQDRTYASYVAAICFVTGLLMPVGSPSFAKSQAEREAYFGETHVHTSWSLDSYLGFGNTIAGPEDFYKYSLGQPITHPGGFTVKITKPLDWAATIQNEPASESRIHSLLQRWLHEPLLQFLLMGLALFGAYDALHPEANNPDSTHRIELTEDDLRQIRAVWLAQGRPSPTPEDMHRLIESKVHEEILYREALALGLDKGDTIVKRRLAKKMEFLLEDLTAVRDPTTEKLKAWFEKNQERFALPPPRISFRHLYFSPDRRGEGVTEAAAAAHLWLAGKPEDSPVAATLGDSFMFQDYYSNRTPEQVAGVFGAAFVSALFQLEPGSWREPIESGLGWHVVWVESIIPSRLPAFEEIEPDIKSRWIEAKRMESRRRTFDAMKAGYEVVLPDSPTMDGMLVSTRETKGTP